jgi:hypothetical protein
MVDEGGLLYTIKPIYYPVEPLAAVFYVHSDGFVNEARVQALIVLAASIALTAVTLP